MATPQTQNASAQPAPPIDFSDLGARTVLATSANGPVDFSDLGAKPVSSPSTSVPGAVPQGTVSAAPPSGWTHPINWLQELEGDIRTGSGFTAPGRLLRSMGAKGIESGTTPAVGETVGGPLIGPVKALRGALRVAHGVGSDFVNARSADPNTINPEILGGANEAIEGTGQALAPVAGATNPEFLPQVLKFGAAQRALQKGAQTLGAGPEAAELAGSLGAGGVGVAAEEATPEALEKVRTGVQSAIQNAPAKVADTVRAAYGIANPDALTAEQSATKAIKPRNSKVNWKQEVNSALPDVRRAIDNSGVDLSTATLDDIDQATTQAKKDVWGEYENKFTKPNQGVTVDATPVAKTIRSTVSQRTLEQNPQLADRIESIAKTYDGRQLSVADLEDRIKELNGETRGIEARFPADKSAAKSLPENAPVFAERNALKNLLISKLDEVEGPGAQDLRTRYGALSSFQDVLQRRKAVYERANPESLGEQVGRFTGVGQMAKGAAKVAAGQVSGIADIAGGVATRVAAKAGRQINDSQYLLRQALQKTTPRPAIVPRVTPEYVTPPAPAALSGIARFLPSGVYEQPAGTPPPEPKLLEHMQPVEPEYLAPEAPAPVRPAGFLRRGVYQQPGGFEPNQPALPSYRGIQLRPSSLKGTPNELPVAAPAENPAPAPNPTRPVAASSGAPAPEPGRTLPVPNRQSRSAGSGAYGSPTQVLTSGANLPGKYKVVEADSLIPSHNAGTFAQNPQYPAGVQERTYHSSKEAQARVIQQSQNYDPNYTVNTNPDAVNGPPIVTKDGIVLGGNSRTMSTQRLYAAGRGDAYKSELLRQAGNFGLDPAAIQGMQKPVLVREVAPQGGAEGMRKLAADLNKSMTGALSVEEKAVSAGRSITPQTLDAIGGMRDSIGEDATLRDVLRKNGRQVLDLMQRDGAVTERERPQLVDTATGGLSEEGKNMVERALLGSVVDDPVLMEHTPKAVLDKVGNSLADVSKLGAREDEYNILPLLREALADHAEMAAHGSDLDTYLGQQGMFGQQRSPATEALVRTLAKRPQQVRLAFRQFGQDAAFNQPGQGTLALTEPPSAAKSFNDAFGAKISDEELLDAIRNAMMSETPHDVARFANAKERARH